MNLSFKGNKALMGMPGVAVVGSQKPTPKARKVAERLGACLVSKDINVVSGYAKGIDQAAHYGALSHQGTTTIVLPYGIKGAYIRRELNEFWSDEQILFISQFPDAAKFSGRNAMVRNQMIVNQSESVIVVESDTKGGTFATGNMTLNTPDKELFVIDPVDLPGCKHGNAELIRRGGTPVRLQEIADRGILMFLK